MIRALASFALLSLCFLQPGLSQETNGSSTTSPNAEITIRGCVSGENRYTLMQASTGAAFALAGDTGRLSSVRGKLIEVRGTEYAPQGNSGELPKLNVKSFRLVADQCPIQPRAESTPASRTET